MQAYKSVQIHRNKETQLQNAANSDAYQQDTPENLERLQDLIEQKKQMLRN